MAGNKCDLIENEMIGEEKARNLAKEMNAIFEPTSAAKNIGIEQLFHNLGCKYIDPNYKANEINSNEFKEKADNENKKIEKDKNKKLKLDDKKSKQENINQKKCC